MGHETIFFNLPLMLSPVLAALALAVPPWRRFGAGVALGAAMLAAPAYIRGYDDLHTRDAGPGFILGQVGFVALLTAAVVALLAGLRDGTLRPGVGRGTALWAGAGALLGGSFVVGDAMNWQQDRIHAQTIGYQFQRTGTATVVSRCCTLLQEHGWTLGAEVAVLILAVIVPIFAACWRARAVTAGLLAGAGLVLLANPLSAVARIAAGITPAALGLKEAQVEAGAILVERSSQPGLWIAMASALGLVGLGTLRGLAQGDE